MAACWRGAQARLRGNLMGAGRLLPGLLLEAALGAATPLAAAAPATPAAVWAAAARATPPTAAQLHAARGWASVKPEDTVYAGPSAPSPKRVTLRTLRAKYQAGVPISMVTAYDYPSAVHVDDAGIDILLVGDSVAMVVHGHDTTLPITLDEMLVHCKAAARGARRAFLVGDMPFGSFEASAEQAVHGAVRMLKEGCMDAVKMEGGFQNRVKAVAAVVEAGVAVMGHVGLTPQAISVLGGFRPAAQSASEALRVIKEAKALEAAGCFALVLECVPEVVAAAITREVGIPTIGIGAGAHTSGQVTPKFCKTYASVGAVIQQALTEYHSDVTTKAFPSARYSPYRIPPGEQATLLRALEQEGLKYAAETVTLAAACQPF
eukprot:scaffold15.g4330.t1